MGKIIAIDLGTTNSCLSVFENGSPTVVVNSEGKRTTPSVVGFDKGERKVGDSAKRQAVINPTKTVYEVKRLIGNSYDDCKQEIERVSYKIVNKDGQPRIQIDDKMYTPEEISATILQKLKNDAEDYLGEKVDKCIITVPAYFSDSQRLATKNAASICSMECVRIINEPTAAALAYGLNKADKDMKIVVFDCGGGTHDVSVLEFGGGVFEVLSTDGDTHLGGSDIDERITDWVVDEFKKDENVDLSKDPMALQRIKEASEKAKIELSSSLQTEINLPYITSVDGVPKHFVKTLTRAKMESMIDDIVKRTIVPCETALKAAGLKKEDIDEIVLVGGSTRIPAIQKAVKDFFGKEPNHSVNPDEAVALGAAVQAGILGGEDGVGDIVLLDVTPLNLGIEVQGGTLCNLVEANTTIPCKKTMEFSNASDMQPNASIVIYSGNRPMAYQNKMLGRFDIELTPSPRGANRIEVSFDIDASGILTVSAVDKALNKPNKITIEAKSSLTEEEIERMRNEAEANQEADKKLKEQADKINTADQFAFGMEKSIDELKDKVTDDEKEDLKKSIESLRKAISEHNMNDIETYQKEIETKFAPISQRIYASQSGNTGNPFGGANPFGGTNPFRSTDNPFGGANPFNTAQHTGGEESADFEEVKD
jgi:molecular chaperone DnaK